MENERSSDEERERKFLVTSLKFLEEHTPTPIAQAYLVSNDDIELRVRIMGQTATMTLKSGRPELVRHEVEYPIKYRADAVNLITSSSLRVSKLRYHVLVGKHGWIVDKFQDLNVGLTIAEVEFDEGDSVEIPDWVGTEVTGDGRFYNRYLAERPFAGWSPENGQ